MRNKRLLLIGPLPEPTTGVSLANRIVHENLKEYQVNTINTSYNKFDENLGAFSFKKVLFFLKMNLYTYKVLKADIIYITPGQTFFGVLKYIVFFLFSKFFKKTIIVHVHGNHMHREYIQLKGLKKNVFKTILKMTDKGIVLSELLKANMNTFLDSKNVFVLYNFVEDYLFVTSVEIESKKLIDVPRIVFLSNLMEEKGIFDLLSALVFLEEQSIPYEAKIAGNIDEMHRDKAMSFFKRLKNTTYLGVVKGQEKKELLLWSNIFVLPTYYTMEGQPISILEAYATGNCVLTTSHAGIPDIFIEKKNGFFVNKRDPNSIAQKIIHLKNNKELSNKIRIDNFNLAAKKYRVQHFINNFVSILKA